MANIRFVSALSLLRSGVLLCTLIFSPFIYGQTHPEIKRLTHAALGELERGNLEAAEDHARHAQHLIHREAGVHDISQLAVLEILNDIALNRFDVDSVTTNYQLMSHLTTRHYGVDHRESANAIAELANWHQALGEYTFASKILRDYLSHELTPAKHIARVQNLLAANQYL